jgi:hypothetical protein
MWCAIPNRKLSNQSHIHTRKSFKLYTFMTWPFLWQRTLHAWASGRANFYPQEDISWCHRFRLRVAALSHHREAIRWDCPRSVLLSYGPVDHLILDDKWSIRKIRVPRKRRWVLHDRLSVNVNLPVFPVGISLWLFFLFCGVTNSRRLLHRCWQMIYRHHFTWLYSLRQPSSSIKMQGLYEDHIKVSVASEGDYHPSSIWW